MLEAILKAGAESAVAEAPALVAGEWDTNGPHDERTGPYLGRVVSRAPHATSEHVALVAAYARGSAGQVRALAPATRADVLERAARGAVEHRDELARLLALELGKP